MVLRFRVAFPWWTQPLIRSLVLLAYPMSLLGARRRDLIIWYLADKCVDIIAAKCTLVETV